MFAGFQKVSGWNVRRYVTIETGLRGKETRRHPVVDRATTNRTSFYLPKAGSWLWLINKLPWFFPSEISECVKKGLMCPNGTTCSKTGNEKYDCVCNEGFQMVQGALNYTCEGKLTSPEWIIYFKLKTGELCSSGIMFSTVEFGVHSTVGGRCFREDWFLTFSALVD